MSGESGKDGDEGRDLRSLDEVHAAVHALSPHELKAMLVSAGVLVKVFGVDGSLSEPTELLQEALFRLLNDDRKWPQNVSFPKVVSNTMRSIASKLRSQDINRARTRAKEAHFFDVQRPSAQTRVEWAEELTRLERALGGDPVLLRVVELRAGGAEAAEIRAELDLSNREWEAISRRARRKLPGLREKGD